MWTVEWVSQKRSTSHERHQPLFCFIIVLSGSPQPLRSVERKVKPHSRSTVLSDSLSLSPCELSPKKEGSLCTVPRPRHIRIEPLFLTFQPINFDSSQLSCPHSGTGQRLVYLPAFFGLIRLCFHSAFFELYLLRRLWRISSARWHSVSRDDLWQLRQRQGVEMVA